MNQSKASRITSEPKSGFITNRQNQSASIASCTRLRHSSTAAEQHRRAGGKHHSGRKSGNPSNLTEPPTSSDSSRTWQSRTQAGGRSSGSPEAIFANHRFRQLPQRRQTHANNAYHGTCSPSKRRYRGFTGSRRREEALKKPSSIRSAIGNLPSPPKRHEESPGEQLPPSANACLQANAAAANSKALTHLSQHHRSKFLGTWPLLLGRRSGMVRRYDGHARYTATGIASLASRLIITANAISRRQWHKLVLSAGRRLAAVPRGAGEYLHAAYRRVLVALACHVC